MVLLPYTLLPYGKKFLWCYHHIHYSCSCRVGFVCDSFKINLTLYTLLHAHVELALYVIDSKSFYSIFNVYILIIDSCVKDYFNSFKVIVIECGDLHIFTIIFENGIAFLACIKHSFYRLCVLLYYASMHGL